MKKDKCAAIVTIHRAADMTPDGRRRIVGWLRNQARFLQNDYAHIGPRYTARWLYNAYSKDMKEKS